MRPTVLVMWIAAIATSAAPAEARPSVAIAGIEIGSDSVGVDVEAMGVARELTAALRRAASRPDSPLQVIDPMVRADDVEALIWGKLIHDGDGWVATIHLSAVGADGDTVSYRATIPRAQTSSVELEKWGRVVYKALLDQVDVDDKIDPEPATTTAKPATTTAKPTAATSGKPPAAKPPVKPVTSAKAGTLNPFEPTKPVPPTPTATPTPTGPINPFAVRDPTSGEVGGPGDDDGLPPATIEVEPVVEPQFVHDVLRPEPRRQAQAQRLFWISAGIAGAGALLWTYSALRISDAEDQLDRLAGCSNCERAIDGANAQGNRWEGISWLAGTATVAGVAATVLFGYQTFVAGQEAGPTDLVGSRRRAPARATVTPAIAPGGVGASVTVAF